MKKNQYLASGLLWLAAATILLWGLGCVPLTDVDEGAFAEASREMLSRGDFVSPWLLDAPRFDKPALIHWLQIAAMHSFGINAFAARLPSALAGLLWCWIAMRWTREIAAQLGISSAAAPFALIIAVTSIALPVISRVSTADAVLNALLAATLYSLWRALLADELLSLKKFTRFAAVFIGLGLLTKGPIAILVPAGASLLATVMQPKLFKNWLKIAFDPIAWLIVMMIAAPWYYLQYQAQGMAFITGFFGKHNLGRYTGTMLGFSGGFWYYPTWMIVSVLPWLPMLLRTLNSLARDPHSYLRHSTLIFLWAIPLFVLVFFSFSSTKLPHYGFYGLTGLFILMALTLTSLQALASNSRFLLIDKLFMALLLLIFAVTFWWAPKLASLTHDAYYHGVLVGAGEVFVAHWLWMTSISLLGCMALFVPIFSFARPTVLSVIGEDFDIRLPAWRLCAGALAFAVCLHLIFVPTVISLLRSPILHAAHQISTIKTPVVSWRLASPSLSFSANRVIPSQQPVLGDTVVLYEKNHQALEQLMVNEIPNAKIKSLWREGGVEIVLIQ